MNNRIVQEDEVSLKELILKIKLLIGHLRAHYLLLFCLTLIGGLIGLGYALNVGNKYVAKLTFALEDPSSNTLNGYASLASQFGFDMLGGNGGAFSGENLLELIKSKKIVKETLLSSASDLNNRSLIDYYLDFSGRKAKWKSNSDLRIISFSPHLNQSSRIKDSVLQVVYGELLKKSLSVNKLDKKLNIVEVEVSSEDEKFSKVFAEALVRNVTRFYVETKTKKSLENVNILQAQADSVRRILNQSITGMAVAIDNNPNPNAARQILRTSSQKKQIDVEANKAILQELVKNLEIAKITLRKETPLIQVIDSPVYPLLVNKINKFFSFLIGAFLAFFMGVCIIVLMEFKRAWSHYENN